jgi:TNF receptor-associated protein 1
MLSHASSFCRFIASAYDKPQYRLHFRSDAPIELKCLFYVPRFHSEKFGMGRVEPGVNLYSRKVLIEAKPADLLPGWLRCVASPLMVAVTTLCGY